MPSQQIQGRCIIGRQCISKQFTGLQQGIYGLRILLLVRVRLTQSIPALSQAIPLVVSFSVF